jgi:2-oxoisovalerate dehydrogenase E1 component beta subunit
VAEEGISVEVVDLRTMRPLDRDRSSPRSRRPASASSSTRTTSFGGYGAEVAAIVAEEAFDYLDGPVTRVAGPEAPAAPYADSLEEAFLITPEKIAAAIRTLAAY